jgi:magnesium-transporting ATPase (P-type)
MTRTGRKIFQSIIESIKDLLPIIIVVGFFQIFVIQKPLDDFLLIIEGLLLIILGLTFFVFGLKIGFFPAGENLAYNFVERASLSWLLIFGFALGFGVTIAEPDLIVISGEVAKAIQESQIIESTDEARKSFQNMFRSIIAFCVGISVILGVLKILKNWSTHSIIIILYLLVILLTPLAPEYIIGIAYDSGGVTTSAITVPLIVAIGVGLASSIRGRNPLVDGFGLIAIASVVPIIGILFFGIFL